MAESTPVRPSWEEEWGFADWVAEQRHRSDRPTWESTQSVSGLQSSFTSH